MRDGWRRGRRGRGGKGEVAEGGIRRGPVTALGGRGVQVYERRAGW